MYHSFKIHNRFPIMIDCLSQHVLSYIMYIHLSLAIDIISVKSKVKFSSCSFIVIYQRYFHILVSASNIPSEILIVSNHNTVFQKTIRYAIIRKSLETNYSYHSIWNRTNIPVVLSSCAVLIFCFHIDLSIRLEWGYALFSFLTKLYPLLNTCCDVFYCFAESSVTSNHNPIAENRRSNILQN